MGKPRRRKVVPVVKKEHRSGILSCSLCSYQTKSSFALACHVERNHITNTVEPTLFSCTSNPPEPYSCQTCNFESNLAVNFNKHVTSDAPPDIFKMFICKNCNFTTFSRLVFMKHTYDKCVHRKQRTMASTNCQRLNVCSDKHSDFVKCHRFLKCIPYNDIRWLKCQHCSYQTKMKGNLKKHMGAYHMQPETVKWFECEQCLYNVKQIFFLREHLLTEHPEDVMFS